MGDSTLQSISIWVSIVLAAIVLGIWSTLMFVQGEYARYQQSEIDAIEQVKEYREWNSYDNTQVYPQDIATLILKKKGSIAVWVDTDVNPAAETWGEIWDETTVSTEFTAINISGRLPVTGIYTSTLIRDLNGSIVRVEFRR